MYKKILVPVDGSATSKMGLGEALKLCAGQDVTIRLVHVVDELIPVDGVDGSYSDASAVIPALIESGENILKESEDYFRGRNVKCKTVLLEHFGGKAAQLIVKEAREWGAEIIVMGTHGRRGLKRLVLGSDAEEIVRTTQVPVLLIRSIGDD